MTRLAAVALALLALPLQDRPVFRSTSRTVHIYATVQGKDGRLVPDLTRDACLFVERKAMPAGVSPAVNTRRGR